MLPLNIPLWYKDYICLVLLLLAFILCWIYSRAISFCFFSFFWDIFFFWATSSSVQEQSALFSRIISTWHGGLTYDLITLHVAWRAHVWFKLLSSVSLVLIFRDVFTWICSMTRESTSKPSNSALLSAFSSKCSKNQHFWGTNNPMSSPIV